MAKAHLIRLGASRGNPLRVLAGVTRRQSEGTVEEAPRFG
jgi:hypothetical protein